MKAPRDEFRETLQEIIDAGDIKDSIIISLEKQIEVRKKEKVSTWGMLVIGIVLGIMVGLILYPFIS